MVEPYLIFGGNCTEAIDFYEATFSGTDKQVMFFRDMPPNPQSPLPDALKDMVMHAELTIEGTRVSFNDNPEGVVSGNQIALLLRTTDSDQVIKWFDALKVGGNIQMDIGPQFFAKMYAWVTDRFGISWQLIAI